MRKLLLLLPAIIFFACGSADKTEHIDDGKAVLVDLGKKDQLHSLDSLVDIVKLVNLETTDSSVLSIIRKVLYINDKFYVLDTKYAAVKAFDNEGKYLYDLGGLGIDTGNYLKITDINYYRPRNTLWVICNSPRKIVEYSMDGKFVREIEMKIYAGNIAIEGPNTRYYYLNQNPTYASGRKNLLVADSLNTINKRVFDFPANIDDGLDFTGGLYNSDQQIFFNPPLSNTYYKLKNGEPTGAYKVDFGSHNLPPAFASVSSMSEQINDYSYLGTSFAKIGDALGFTFVDQRMLQLAFFNTRTRHIARNDFKLSPLNNLFTFSLYASDSAFINPLDTRGLTEYLQNNEAGIKSRFPGLYEKVINKKEHDNPTLILFKLKPF